MTATKTRSTKSDKKATTKKARRPAAAGKKGAAPPEATAGETVSLATLRKGKAKHGKQGGQAADKPLKATGNGKPKRMSALDAATQVLEKAGKPMRATEMIAAMAEQKLWTSPGGRTPQATLYAAMTREINEKKSQARFKKVDRGQFAFNGKGA